MQLVYFFFHCITATATRTIMTRWIKNELICLQQGRVTFAHFLQPRMPFRLHVLRSLHQIAVCKRAAEESPQLPNLSSFGREVKHDCLLAKPMTKPSKPQSVKHKIKCNCPKGKCLRGCMCSKPNVVLFHVGVG